MNVPYISGTTPPPELPLGRFLPPIPQGMITTWCHENLQPNDWVLEPFGFNPLVPIEIAAAGHTVLVTVNNPIHSFMLQVLASAPKQEELIGALQDLATATRGDERMEPYIRALYFVNCGDCNRQIEADAFLWKKDETLPFAAQVDCPHCGARGEQTLNDKMLQSMTPVPPKKLHVARALNRIADLGDSLRSQVESAINAYPARPLIVLQTMINKLDGLDQTPRRRELLIALILSAADQGNTLWAYPSPRNRPRQIVIPTVYQERNLWKVLEGAVDAWQVMQTAVPISEWDGVPANPKGIYRFQGRIKELETDFDDDFFAAILAVIPRPNQAFWTLSALWTGWIWGHDAVAPIRQVLSRQRYDWNWHTNALAGVFDTTHTLHYPGQKFIGIIAENEPLLLLATLLAAESAGYKLTAYAQSLDDQLGQCYWQSFENSEKQNKLEKASIFNRQNIKTYLQQKGEPALYQQIYAASVTGLASEKALALNIFLQNTNQSASETHKWIESAFTEGSLLTQVGEETAALETGTWWLAHPDEIETPLIDRVEEIIIRHLVAHETTTAKDLKQVVHEAFPGIFTPEDAILLNCLESYADLVDPETHLWQLRPSETPSARRADIDAIRKSLEGIGERLDFKISSQNPLLWFSTDNPLPSYRFHIFSSAIISKHIIDNGDDPDCINILVVPGSRSNLLAFKTQRDPVLRHRLNHHFLIVKYRLIRDLAANALLSRELFNQQIQADPPEYRASQMVLF